MNLQEMKETLKKYELDLEEVRAYRNLQNEGFDFGLGYIEPESKESYDAYLEMEEQELEEMIENIKYMIKDYQKENEQSKRVNRYKRKRKREDKLQRLVNNNSYVVYTKERDGKEYIVRVYSSGRKGFAKKQSNRVIRNSRNDFQLKGSGYRKKYDYWWTVY